MHQPGWPFTLKRDSAAKPGQPKIQGSLHITLQDLETNVEKAGQQCHVSKGSLCIKRIYEITDRVITMRVQQVKKSGQTV